MKKTLIILSIIVAVTIGGLFALKKLNPTASDNFIRPILSFSVNNHSPEQRLEYIKKYITQNIEENARSHQSLLHNRGLLKKDVTLIFQKPLIELLSGNPSSGITKAVTQINLESLYDHTDWQLPKSDSKVSANITLDLEPNLDIESPVTAQADFDAIFHGENIFMKLRDIQSNYPQFEVSLTDLEKNGLAIKNQWVDMLESSTETVDPEKIRQISKEQFEKNFMPATTLYTPTTSEKVDGWFVYTYNMSSTELDTAVKGFLTDIANPLANELYAGEDELNMAMKTQFESTLLGMAQALDLTMIEKAQLVFKSHATDIEKWDLQLQLGAQGMMLSLNVGNNDIYQGSLTAGMSTDGITIDQPLASANWSTQNNLFTLDLNQGGMSAQMTLDNQETKKEAVITFMEQPVFNLTLLPSGYKDFWNIDAKALSGGQTMATLTWNVTDSTFMGTTQMMSPFGESQGFELSGTHEANNLEANLSMVEGENKESLGTLSLMKKSVGGWTGTLTAIPSTSVMIHNFKFNTESTFTDWDIDLTVLESNIELGQVISKGSWEPKSTVNVTEPLNTIPLSQFMQEFEENNGGELIDFIFTPSPKNDEGTSPYYDPNDIETLLEQMSEYEETETLNEF